MAWKYEFDMINAGVAVAWSYDETYAYMLGYQTNDGTEILVILKDPYMTRASDQKGQPDAWVIPDNININTYSPILYSNTLFGHPSRNFQVIMVAETSFRKAQIYPAKLQFI